MFDSLYAICRHLFKDAIKQWSGCQKYELFQRQSLLLSDLTSPNQEEKMKIKQFVTMDKLQKYFVQINNSNYATYVHSPKSDIAYW